MNGGERHWSEGIIVLYDISHGRPRHCHDQQDQAGEKATKARGVFHFIYLSFPTLAVDVILEKTSSVSQLPHCGRSFGFYPYDAMVKVNPCFLTPFVACRGPRTLCA